MNEIKNKIDQELVEMKLPLDFADNIIEKENKKKVSFYKKVPTIAAAVLIIVCLAVPVTAALVIHEITNVNGQVIPQLDGMKVKPYIIPDDGSNINIEKEYKDYKTLEKELPFAILESDYAVDEKMISVHYQRGRIYQYITIDGYIWGDVQLLKMDMEDRSYSYLPGEKYDSPIDLRIEILSNEDVVSKPEHGYLGNYKFEEQYISEQGYKVNLLSDDRDEGVCTAIFVADGIRYQLDGRVSVETMKDIVDSMK